MTNTLQVAPGVSWVDIDGEVLILGLEQLHFLNPSGAAVWRLIRSGRGTAEIAETVKRQHGAKAGTQALDLIAQLMSAGLIREAPPSVGAVRIPPHVAWTIDESGLVALRDLRSGEGTALSETATAVWLELSDGTPVKDVPSRIAAAFDADPAMVQSAVATLMHELLDKELLARATASGEERYPESGVL